MNMQNLHEIRFAGQSIIIQWIQLYKDPGIKTA